MRRLVTAVNNEQYRIIENYCKNKGISIWKLLKDSVLERVGNKTLDDFVK